MGKQYEYDTVIHELPEKGGAYVVSPWDIRAAFCKGRVKVKASFVGLGTVCRKSCRDASFAML